MADEKIYCAECESEAVEVTDDTQYPMCYEHYKDWCLKWGNSDESRTTTSIDNSEGIVFFYKPDGTVGRRAITEGQSCT